MNFELTYKPFGERSVLIEWPSKINKSILEDIISFKEALQKRCVKEKVYVKSAYSSILISYSFTINNIYDEISALKTCYATRKNINESTFKLWKIPVCYNEEFGIDLKELSTQNDIQISRIIELHSAQKYTVYFTGFLPGFLYLGGLDEQLYFPRKETPRLKIIKGAVAIGGEQTGIYPNESPGGWNIIGNSPINFFDVKKEVPCFAKAGDFIQFYAIDKMEYDDIKALVDAGAYQLESEVIND